MSRHELRGGRRRGRETESGARAPTGRSNPAMSFDSDLRDMLALSDARKLELASERGACLRNTELADVLLADRRRRGYSDIDWPEYFRNTRMI